MLKIYRTNTNAVIPKFATQQSACFDISSCGKFVIPPNSVFGVPTGLILDIPKGYSVRLHPRSGLALKKKITMMNAEGIIDSDYINELHVILWNTSTEPFHIETGDRIAQGELVKNLDYTIEECYNPPEQKTDRVGGFGSTGVSV